MKPRKHRAIDRLETWMNHGQMTLHRMARQLESTVEEVPDEFFDVRTAVSACQENIKQLQEKVRVLFESDAVRNMYSGHYDVDSAEVPRLLALNQRLKDITTHLHEVVSDVTPKMEAKLADPTDPMYDYEIEIIIDYYLRDDDPDYREDDDNILTTRNTWFHDFEEVPDLQYDWAESCFNFPELRAEPHCWLFHDLYDHDYGAESPKLSLEDCLRVGKVFVDVQVWQQYQFDVLPVWSSGLQQETREAIESRLITPDDSLYFKHPTLGYVWAEKDDINSSGITLRSKADKRIYHFTDVDALLKAGWAVD